MPGATRRNPLPVLGLKSERMRSVQLTLLGILGAFPSAIADELDRTRWVGPAPAALQATLPRHDGGYRLVADGGIAPDAFYTAKADTCFCG